MKRRGRPPYPDILTPREFEVLALLRENLTNEQIAYRLGVTPYAAKYHVSEILSKLGVARREEAAAWRRLEEVPRRGWAQVLRGALLIKAFGAAVVSAAAISLVGLSTAVIISTTGGVTDQVAADPSPTGPPSPTSTSLPSPSPDLPGLPRIPVSDRGVFIADRDGSDDHQVGAGFSPVWSPDGKRIAYVAATTGSGATGIDWVHDMAADGTDTHEIGGYDWAADSPPGCAPFGLGAWAPDAVTFAIWTGPGRLHHAQIVDVETGQGEPFGGCYSQWLPDGRLLFHTACDTAGAEQCIKLLDQSGEVALTTGHLASPSPNGRWLAIGRGDDLWVRDMHTGDEVLLAQIPVNGPSLPDWSPDNKTIIVSSSGILYIVSLENGAIRMIGRGVLPKWSPDGSRIAYFEADAEPLCGNRMRVVDKELATEIFSAPAAGYVFDWSPDGKQIAYSRQLEIEGGLCDLRIHRNITNSPTMPSTPTPTPEPPTPSPTIDIEALFGPRIEWQALVAHIWNCEATHAAQARTLMVSVTLKNGYRYHSFQPRPRRHPQRNRRRRPLLPRRRGHRRITGPRTSNSNLSPTPLSSWLAQDLAVPGRPASRTTSHLSSCFPPTHRPSPSVRPEAVVRRSGRRNS